MSGPQLPKGVGEQLQVLQEKLLQAQKELANETVTATAGGGTVKITLTGDQRCTEVVIAPEALQDADAEMLADLVMTAVNKALDDSRTLAADRLSPYAPNLK
jgi:DNA-binding YbaB/EbfC family protein